MGKKEFEQETTEIRNDYKRLSVLSILILLAIIIMVAGVSYAYFTRKIEGGDNTRVIIKTADILLKYDEGDALQAFSIQPGWSGDLTFSIENYSAEIDAKYKIILEITSPFTDVTEENFVYTLTSSTDKEITDNNNLVSISQTPMPIQTTELGVAAITKETIHNYTLNVQLLENGKDQNYLKSKTFIGKIVVESVYE